MATISEQDEVLGYVSASTEGEVECRAAQKLASAMLLRALRDAFSRGSGIPEQESRLAEIWLLDCETKERYATGILCRTCCEALDWSHTELIRTLYSRPYTKRRTQILAALSKQSQARQRSAQRLRTAVKIRTV